MKRKRSTKQKGKVMTIGHSAGNVFFFRIVVLSAFVLFLSVFAFPSYFFQFGSDGEGRSTASYQETPMVSPSPTPMMDNGMYR